MSSVPLPTCGFFPGKHPCPFSIHLPENLMCKLIGSACPLSWILDVTRHTAATCRDSILSTSHCLTYFSFVKFCVWVGVCVWVCTGSSGGQQWSDQPLWAICCGCWELNSGPVKSSKSPCSRGHLCSLSKLSSDVSVHHEWLWRPKDTRHDFFCLCPLSCRLL